MSLVTPKELLEWAEALKIAVGAFNVHAADAALGVLDAAESSRTPVIIQVNEASIRYASIEFWAGMARALAGVASTPWRFN